MPEPADSTETAQAAFEAATRRAGKERLSWRKPELAWPLALVAGFGGTSLGLVVGIPGLAPLLAFAAWAPFFVMLVSGDARRLAALASAAWCVAVAGAVAGAAIEGSPAEVQGQLFFARPETLAWFDLGSGGRALRIAWALLGVVLACLLARPFRGAILLLLVAVLVCAVAGAGSDVGAVAVAEAEAEGFTASTIRVLFAGWPPAVLPTLIGILIAGAAIACPGRLLPLSGLDRGRRHQIELGLFVCGLALFTEPLYGPLLERLFGAV